MKTIKKQKAVRDTLVFVLLLMLLLSSMIGTIVAVKPENPGTPDNKGPKPGETWDLTIYIGEADDDIVLQNPPLSAEDVPCSAGLWNIPDPEAKGNGRKGRYVSAQLLLSKWLGDDCGTYTVADELLGTNSDKEETWLDEVIPDNPEYHLVEVDIGHQVNPLGQDYWWFRLIWNPQVPDPDEWGGYWLCAWTDKGADGEVMPPEGNELVIQFEEVDAVLTGDMLGPLDVPENYNWLGKVSFTITITREPYVA